VSHHSFLVGYAYGLHKDEVSDLLPKPAYLGPPSLLCTVLPFVLLHSAVQMPVIVPDVLSVELINILLSPTCTDFLLVAAWSVLCIEAKRALAAMHSQRGASAH